MSSSDKLLEGLHLLIIEDEQDITELLTFILQLEGAKVTAVVHVREALEALERFRPDVILSNIHLPDGDGYALLEKWRDKEAKRNIKPIPAIIVTESDREIHRTRMSRAGFQTHISRPFDVDRIPEIVASVARASN